MSTFLCNCSKPQPNMEFISSTFCLSLAASGACSRGKPRRCGPAPRSGRDFTFFLASPLRGISLDPVSVEQSIWNVTKSHKAMSASASALTC